MGPKGSIVYGQPAGQDQVEMDPRKVWTGHATRQGFKVLDKVHTKHGSSWLDIAILETTNDATFGYPVEIDFDVQLTLGDCVDTVGYPANYDELWIKEHHPTIPDASLAIQQAIIILPKWRLVVSSGNLISTGNNPEYKLSTCGGMSGGPVVYKGKVIGMSTCHYFTNMRRSCWG